MFGRIGWVELLVILAIVILIFGTKKLPGLGRDLGAAIRGFKGGLKDSEKDQASTAENKPLPDNDKKPDA